MTKVSFTYSARVAGGVDSRSSVDIERVTNDAVKALAKTSCIEVEKYWISNCAAAKAVTVFCVIPYRQGTKRCRNVGTRLANVAIRFL